MFQSGVDRSNFGYTRVHFYYYATVLRQQDAEVSGALDNCWLGVNEYHPRDYRHLVSQKYSEGAEQVPNGATAFVGLSSRRWGCFVHENKQTRLHGIGVFRS